MTRSKYSIRSNLARLWRLLTTKATHQVDEMTEKQAAEEMRRLAAEATEDLLRHAQAAERLIQARNKLADEVISGNRKLNELNKTIQRRVDVRKTQEQCLLDPELCSWMSQRSASMNLLAEQERTLERMKASCLKASEFITAARAAEAQIQGELGILMHRLEMAELAGSSGYTIDVSTLRGRMEVLRKQVANKEYAAEARQEVQGLLSAGDAPLAQSNALDFTSFLQDQPKSAELPLHG